MAGGKIKGFFKGISTVVGILDPLQTIPRITLLFHKNILFYYAQKNYTNAIKALGRLGTPLDAPDPNDGDTALHVAAHQGHNGVVSALIVAGANIAALNSEKETPLHMAVRGIRRDAVQILLKACPNFNAKKEYLSMLDNFGRPVLHIAIHSGDVETMRLLLANGADPNQKDPTTGNTALHVIAERAGKEGFNIEWQMLINLLAFHNANFDITNIKGLTPALLAASRLQFKIAHMMNASKAAPITTQHQLSIQKRYRNGDSAAALPDASIRYGYSHKV